MATPLPELALLSSPKEVRSDILAGAQRRLDAQQNGRAIVKYISGAVDNLLITMWDDIAGDVGRAVDVIAVGGYGRAELCPHSDWDLLFLVADARNERVNSAIQKFAQAVWDTGATLGHAVRTPNEAREFADNNHHARTALLESRLLAGSGQLYGRLMRRAAQQHWSRRRRVDFCRTKITECTDRRQANGNTAFVMEPDIKDGKGGLRDVSTIFWLSMAWYGVPTARELIGQGVVSENEFNGFVRAREFLWRVRSGLHLLAGREDDRLRFEYQAELARRFRYRDSEKSSAVERFLKNYFLNVRAIADLSDIFLLHFEEQVNPPRRGFRRKMIGGGMSVRNQKVSVIDVDAFAADPLNVMRIFRETQKEERYMNSRALRIVREHAHLITAAVRNDPDANQIFLDILRSDRIVTTALSQMHETGVLGRFCPDFGRITGYGQFDRYHQYTVDAHTIRAINILRDFILGETRYLDFPLGSQLMPKLKRPELLYLALLYHDIAKGSGRDHSEYGEELSRKFCARLGLSDDDIDLVAWLVLHHLRLSKTAQHYDLSDPEVIADFASFVGDRERLDYLFLLTVADVTAVGPGTWTDWKGYLFTQLYRQAETSLRTGAVEPQNLEERMRARRKSVLDAAEPAERADLEMRLTVMSSTLTLNFPPSELLELARLIRTESGAELIANEEQGHTRVIVWGLDRPRLFSHLTATLAHANTRLVAAQAYALRDGRILDQFLITDSNNNAVAESGQMERLEKRLRAVLDGAAPPEIKPGKLDILMREQAVTVQRRAAAARHVTAIEVVAADRKGLLAALAGAIADVGVDIRGASVSTFGEKAVDVFFVTDGEGRPINDATFSRLVTALTGAAELDVETA